MTLWLQTQASLEIDKVAIQDYTWNPTDGY